MNEEYIEYLQHLGELSHTPIDGPRPSHVGENVYAYEWAQLMTRHAQSSGIPNELLASILWDMYVELTQRHASVAASVITWLGCNAGQALMLNARAIALVDRINKVDAYLCAWTMANRRARAVSRGVRTIESILAPGDHWGNDMFSGACTLIRLPEITIDDYETVEHVIAWLGTSTATDFIIRCEGLIRMRETMSADETVRAIALGRRR